MWDSATGKLKKDLAYQAEEMFMMHDEAVLALNFSRDSELLVSCEHTERAEGESRDSRTYAKLLMVTPG